MMEAKGCTCRPEDEILCDYCFEQELAFEREFQKEQEEKRQAESRRQERLYNVAKLVYDYDRDF